MRNCARLVPGGRGRVVLALTAALTSVVARRITRRLRWLQESASTAAYQRLPVVVRELNAAPAGTVRHEEVADRSAADLILDDEDEIAEVGAAVRELYREAVLTAGEQAVMRKNIADMFVHLSHREQRLVDALLAQVDRVEYDETDPDRLRQLYQLDNLATRMARINQSLLVLGGSGTSRVRPEAVPMVTVVQAALSQIEQYTRVRIGTLDNGLDRGRHAVDEMAHMLAELLDNATTYSPPEDRGVGDRTAVARPPHPADHRPGRRAVPTALRAHQRPLGCSSGSGGGGRPGDGADGRGPAGVPARYPGRAACRPPGWHGGRGDDPLEPRPQWVTPTLVPTAAGASVARRRERPANPSSPLFRRAAPASRAPDGQWLVHYRLAGADVTWPTNDGEPWAAAMEPAANLTVVTTTGLPQRHAGAASGAHPPSGADRGPHRRLDPTSIAAAMSAYARGVAGYRAPSS